MKQSRVVILAAVVLTALLPSGVQARSSVNRIPRLGPLVPLDGSVAPHLGTARRLAMIAPARTMSVAVSLKVRDQSGLDSLLHEQYTPGSVLFHHWLTPGQFAARFAPTPAVRQQVSDWMQSKGLRVRSPSRNGLLLNATGTAIQLEGAFGTRIFTYRQGAQSFFANSQPIQIPAGLKSQIAAVSGLNNAEVDRPISLHKSTILRHPSRADLSPLTPATLATLYDIKPLYQSGISGSSQTIAIVQFTDFSDSNVATFDKQFGIPGPTLKRIAVSDGTTSGSSRNDNQSEAELDIEIAHAIAPKATLLIYIAPQDSSPVDVWTQIVSDNKAQIVTTSYGASESHVSGSYMTAMDQILKEAAAQGQSTFAPSGDNGAYDAAELKDDPDKMVLQVDFPASDPWITAVGGTGLAQNTDGSLYETPWADHAASNPRGTGGGLSRTWPKPTYQSGPGVDNQYSNGNRQVPDVSAFGDPDHPGYAIYTTQGGTTDWAVMGGTSAATPFWAAYTALINEAFNLRLGFLNPTLYTLGQKAATFPNAPFNDVTVGDNLYYPATPGWDFASGWGTMDGLALVNDIQALGTPLAVHAADWTMRVEMDKFSAKHWSPLTQVKRGKKVYLRVIFTVTALPNNATATRALTFTSASGVTIYRGTGTIQMSKTDLGKKKSQYQTVLVPKNAPTGTYTLTAKMTVAGVGKSSSIQVQVT